jgi:hypothetical protein
VKALAAVLVAVAALTASAQGTERQPSTLPGSVGSAPVTIGVGETADFAMYSHCGVESTEFNGRVWNAVEPLYATPERLGPPAGWGDPEQEGRLTLEAPDRAVFTALGARVVLVPSATGEPLRYCR